MRFVAGCLLGLAGCSGGAEPPDDSGSAGGCSPGGEPTLEIGIGLSGFEAVEDGGAFPLIHGPQGGYHLEIGLRATHLDTSELASGHLTGVIGGEPLAESRPWIDLRCVGDVEEAWGMLLIYDSTPDQLDGQTTEVTAEVTDAAGTTVTTTATFVIEDTQ